MKILLTVFKSYVLICIAVFAGGNLQAQCAGGVPPSTISFDFDFGGNGNDNYPMIFPKFDPMLGDLYEVTIEKTVTLQFEFTLENRLMAAPITKSMRVQRSDEIVSTALASPINYTSPNFLFGPITLQASDGALNPDAGPDYYSLPPTNIIDHVTQTSNVTAVSGFIGAGNVSLDYNTSTGTQVLTNGSNVSTSNNIEETVHFHITYNYCANAAVPSGITDFRVAKVSDTRIGLTWFHPNDEPGKKYVVEKSLDGRNFIAVGTLLYSRDAKGKYSFNYELQPGDKGYIFFRIKEVNADEKFDYTATKGIFITVPNASNLIIYPTLATDYIQIYLPGNQKTDWQINIISLSGQIVQKQQFRNTNLMLVAFVKKFPAGLYIVQAMDIKTNRFYQSKIIIE